MPLKKFTFSFVVFLFCFFVYENKTSAQDVQWFKTFGSNNADQGIDVISDENQNAYVTGYFNDNMQVGTHQLNSRGGEDIFLAKYDSIGNILWATSFGGIYTDEPKEINFSKDGNILMTGYFNDTCQFGSKKVIASGSSFTDLFLTKIDRETGEVLWVQSAGSPNSEEHGNAICDDGSGNILVAGNFIGTCYFGTDSIVSKKKSLDFFIAKYDADGILLWVKGFGGKGNDDINSIATDANQNIFYCGVFQDTMKIEATELISKGQLDMYWCKLNPDGDLIWANSAGGKSSENARKINVLPDGSFYIGGSLVDSVFFAGQWISDIGNGDIFISKFNPSGVLEWVHSGYNANAVDYIRDLAIDKKGSVYIAGLSNFFVQRLEEPGRVEENFDAAFEAFASACPFGDMIVAKYDSAGNIQWIEHSLGNNINLALGVSVDNHGNCYATGYFTDSISFYENWRTGNGGSDVWVLKFKDNSFFTQSPKVSAEAKFDVSLFPNPMNNWGYIKIYSSQTEQFKIGIQDLSGRIIRQYNPMKISEGTTVIPLLSDMPSGFYLLTVAGEKYSEIIKFIVQ